MIDLHDVLASVKNLNAILSKIGGLSSLKWVRPERFYRPDVIFPLVATTAAMDRPDARPGNHRMRKSPN